jgi:hypothetical protein
VIKTIKLGRRPLRNNLFLNFRSSLILGDILRREPCCIRAEKILLAWRNLVVFEFEGFDFSPGGMVFFG